MPFLLPKEPRFQLDPELQEFLRRRYTETPARRPLPIPEAVEGEGEGETLLEKLTGRITAEEEAALAGKATGPDTAQQYFGDASNIFLTAAGLPAQPVRTPARDERQSMRDWVMRRAQLAQGTETRAQAAERTKAYAASVEQQRLRDLERQAQAAEAAGRQADAFKFRQEMERERLGIEKERLGLERQKAEAEAKRRAAGAGVASKAAEEKAKREARALTEGLPYGYRLKTGANPSKKQREDAATAVEQRDAVAPIITRLEQLTSQGVERLASPTARAEVQQAAQQIGAAIRTIENLGVPSGPDMKIQLQLIGDPTSAVNEVAGVLPKLMGNLRDYFSNKTETRLRTFGIEKEGASETPTEAPRDGLVTIRQKSTGKTKTLPADKAGRFLRSAEFEEVR